MGRQRRKPRLKYTVRGSGASSGFDDLLIDNGWSGRLYFFNGCVWREETVHLDGCSVFPGMGGLRGLRGKVPFVARKIAGVEFKDSDAAKRIREMEDSIGLIADSLHLILAATGAHPRCQYLPRPNMGQYSIDDGSHRAVAMWLQDRRRAKAFVARHQG